MPRQTTILFLERFFEFLFVAYRVTVSLTAAHRSEKANVAVQVAICARGRACHRKVAVEEAELAAVDWESPGFHAVFVQRVSVRITILVHNLLLFFFSQLFGRGSQAFYFAVLFAVGQCPFPNFFLREGARVGTGGDLLLSLLLQHRRKLLGL